MISRLAAFLLIVTFTTCPAWAEAPNAAAMRNQGAQKFPSELFTGIFEGEFRYLHSADVPKSFTVVLEPNGKGRWKGFVRDADGPQAKVEVAYDGLTFQMSKHYGEKRPAGYPEWVYYVGTLKHDPDTGYALVLGIWSIPGVLEGWGTFVIDFAS